MDVFDSLQRCRDACLHDFKQLKTKYFSEQANRSISDHGRNMVRKLKYSFNREEFENLQRRLQEFHILLIGYLQLIGLDATRDIQSVVLSESTKVSVAIESTRAQLQSSISDAGQVVTGAIHNGMTRLESTFQGSFRDITDRLEEIQGRYASELMSNLDRWFKGQTEDSSLYRQTFNRLAASYNMNASRISINTSDRNIMDLGPFYGSLRVSPTIHHPGGPQYWSTKRKKYQFSVRFKVFRRLLTASLGAECSSLLRMRILQIYHNLIVCTTVPNNSPAFMVVRRIYIRRDCPGIQDFKTLLDDGLIELQQIFDSGKGWPTDINSTGVSLLHHVAKFCTDSGQNLWHFSRFVRELINMGLPLVEDVGESGHTWDCWHTRDHLLELFLRSHYRNRDLNVNCMIDDLLGAGAHINEMSWCVVVSILSLENSGLYHFLSSTQFHDQVLLRSESEVIRLLNRDHSLLYQRNEHGQTAFHLATNWPRGLEILIQFADKETDSLINIRDNLGFFLHTIGYSALDYSIELRNVDSVRLLLREGAGISTKTFRRLSRPKLTIEIEEIESTVAKSLVSQRINLSQLALDEIPAGVADDLGLNGVALLDDKAFNVAEALRHQGVRLRTKSDDLAPVSVYHWHGLNASISQKLFDAGFRDPNVAYQGHSPLVVHAAYYRKYDDPQLFQLYYWFKEHGADIYAPVPVHNNRTPEVDDYPEESRPYSIYPVTHLIADNLGYASLRDVLSNSPNRILLPLSNPAPGLLSLLWDETHDPCLCYCTIGGCTSASKYAYGGFVYRGSPSRLTKLEEKLKCMTHWLGEMTMRDHESCRVAMDLIRVITFETLNMTHTCCHCGHEPRVDDNFAEIPGMVHLEEPEEVEEIREEEKHLAELLGKLMGEFESKFRELDVPFGCFVEEYFFPRIKEIEKEKDKLSVETTSAMRKIGVVLHET
ncbi:uncharacterized protein F4822DRAFT_101288 [Hypoxylon trugodes]|uniref:uncharacterized protein n=1 Tax=Hypoxylon trugodes TaxID=326681 RepID=UPI002194002F|nr:uncharacterized protein F4822DRAFT_101288 [Hypoxylon trugodes]KAI1382627.1 hypothetical protein F4822DRAFT_101288 [Hypoxylon trugodes]